MLCSFANSTPTVIYVCKLACKLYQHHTQHAAKSDLVHFKEQNPSHVNTCFQVML